MARATIAEPVSHRTIYRLLGDERIDVIADFRVRGGNLDRWRGPDWLEMAGCLTRIEDSLENQRESFARTERRADIAVVRRKLEDGADIEERLGR